MNLSLDTLNPEQRAAVHHIDGPLLLLAGAGSGKTRTITQRIGYLILKGVEPENILAVSFTNKAAGEMRERVADLVGHRIAERATLSTFHSLGANILREHIGKLGYRTPFTILDQGDQLSLLRDILNDLRLDPKVVDPRGILFLVSRAKMAFDEPAALKEFRFHPLMPYAQKVFPKYQSALRGLNALDFDDLICLPVRLFREHEEVRCSYGTRYRYVMVDEYQDTNHTQLLFVQEIVRDHNNVCVVGDDDQSIYAFRGAVAGNILDFERQFPGARVIKLEQNYRSTNAILKAANAVIANNPARKEKNLWSAKGDGKPVRIVVCDDEREEAEYVAAEIDRMRSESGRPWGDYAVLFRSNPQTRIFEEAFRTHDVPYRIIGSQEFFDRREVKDVIAYLRVCSNPNDEVSFRRVVNVPPRGVGATSMERLAAEAVEGGVSFWQVVCDVAAKRRTIEGLRSSSIEKLSELVDVVRRHRVRFAQPGDLVGKSRALLADLHFIDYLRSSENSDDLARRRVENVNEFLDSFAEWEAQGGNALDAYLTRITLDSAVPDGDADVDAVQLLTLHSSKGLEFPVVFLVGMEEGYLPHARAVEEPGGIEEERRLCYVGITRAQEQLTLTRARARKRFGSEETREPSRFLKEIPAELLERGDAAQSTGLADKRKELGSKYLRAFLANLD